MPTLQASITQVVSLKLAYFFYYRNTSSTLHSLGKIKIAM
ncbi:hypothetical protein HMPREF0220_0343 [Clostridioides difficile NAP08]|uniref:Uncharacterized protein n=1 Tax=Clostridioides difficile NAP08 TaxID=525259 RepID=D5Q0B1_CLODI|nr:hypothetical protein HMPREF0220_0343 [Clostridioides difficile NAP08]EFH14145.1 hypothetical protein HMPREF0219_3226 [Clostridioides difficile NAP07]